MKCYYLLKCRQITVNVANASTTCLSCPLFIFFTFTTYFSILPTTGYQGYCHCFFVGTVQPKLLGYFVLNWHTWCIIIWIGIDQLWQFGCHFLPYSLFFNYFNIEDVGKNMPVLLQIHTLYVLDKKIPADSFFLLHLCCKLSKW